MTAQVMTVKVITQYTELVVGTSPTLMLLEMVANRSPTIATPKVTISGRITAPGTAPNSRMLRRPPDRVLSARMARMSCSAAQRIPVRVMSAHHRTEPGCPRPDRLSGRHG